MITLASANPHKLHELRELLHIPLRGLHDIPDAPPVIEDGDTFEANAIKKAASLAAFTHDWALADDSGLEVDALHGAPGIHSARFAGRHGDDPANNRLLLQRLAEAPDRTARFVCVLALCGPDRQTHTVRGECPGRIALAPAGSSGFGYDPLFIPDGHTQTFAQLGPDLKQRLSHRARAIQALRAQHGDILRRVSS